MDPDLLIVAGPTASGKSALALGLAARVGGVVINMDAMQSYRDLRVLTARPTPEDEAAVPHALYGVLPASETTSAAWWRGAALGVLKAARAAGRVPVLCGGTGLYLSALLRGIADIPPVPENVRSEARALLAERGAAFVHGLLDEESAARLRPSDSQRVCRAYEVLVATGRGIADWQADWQAGGMAGLEGWRARMILLDPPRADLRAAIAARFAAMLETGALDEARALLCRADVPPDAPILRAHGVPELAAHLRGEITLAEAEARAIAATARYTKRQATWFRHQNPVVPSDTHIIHARIGDFTEFYVANADIIELFAKNSG